VVFVTPTALQLSIFAKILNTDKLDKLMQSSTAESLALINMLTKISNSPILLKATADKVKSKGGQSIQRAGVDDALNLLPDRAQVEDVTLSGTPDSLLTDFVFH
jgi:DNA repair and recombination protein RAD54B